VVKCLENALAVWGKNPTLHSLGNLHLGGWAGHWSTKTKVFSFGICCP